MTKDYFALLGQPRQPWLEPERLKAKFLALSNEVHPDHFPNASHDQKQAAVARFADLNEAHQRLREPKDRLRHLLELELGRKPDNIQGAPPHAMELFMQLAQLCRQVDAFLSKRAIASSPMLKAQMFGQALEWIDQLQAEQQTLASHQGNVDRRLRELNERWLRHGHSPKPVELLTELEGISRELGFLARWSGQVQERMVRLST
jgi:curved DNA-binding protein CbpA